MHPTYVASNGDATLVHGCMVYTELTPRQQQFHVAPTVSKLSSTATILMDIEKCCVQLQSLIQSCREMVGGKGGGGGRERKSIYTVIHTLEPSWLQHALYPSLPVVSALEHQEFGAEAAGSYSNIPTLKLSLYRLARDLNKVKSIASYR